MEDSMRSDERDILQVLKTELDFLRRGGYRRVARAPWRAPLYFEDSPSCPRLRQFSHESHPCQDCVLFRFVPPDAQDENVPCQHIPLTSDSQTLHMLYHWGTPAETRAALEQWLTRIIERIEVERAIFSGFEMLQLPAWSGSQGIVRVITDDGRRQLDDPRARFRR